MEQDMIFETQFSVIGKEGKEIVFDYFLFEETPIIRYNKRGHSFCTNFENQNWKSIDGPDFSNKGLVFLCTSNELTLDWCSLFHEMGHIINDNPFTSQGRLDKVEFGVVSTYELEADRNVLKNMGRQKTEYWLTYLASRLSKEIDLKEDARNQGNLKPIGEHFLKRSYLSREEVYLRIKYL
jgi:hypothetical protein